MNNRRLIILLLSVVFVLTLLTACGNEIEPDEPPIALAIVVGRRAASNDFTEEMYNEVEVWVRRAVYGGTISIIISDGQPFVVKTFGADAFPTNARSRQYMNNLIDRRTKEVMTFLRDSYLRARSPEADVLNALVLAERSLDTVESYNLEQRIVMMDSGLPTAGFLNLHNIQIEEGSAENGGIDRIVSELSSRRGVIPNLSDISIQWIGLGNVSQPQQLPTTIGVQLEELWRALLRESYAVFEDRDIRIRATGGTPNVASEDEGGFPFVTPIFFCSFTPTDFIELPPLPASPMEGEDETICVIIDELPSITITSEQVAFVPNEDIFINEAAASLVLEAYVEWLIKYFDVFPDSRVYIVGFHANLILNGGDRLDTRLSEQRAEAVGNVLATLGVAEERLVVVGLGINGGEHFRVDEFPNGVFCTVTAQANRKVMLIPDLSEDAEILLEVMEDIDALRHR